MFRVDMPSTLELELPASCEKCLFAHLWHQLMPVTFHLLIRVLEVIVENVLVAVLRQRVCQVDRSQNVCDLEIT